MIKFIIVITIMYTNILLSNTVHFFGDSHSFFSFTNKGVMVENEISTFHFDRNNLQHDFLFNIHWLGPITMYRIGRDGIHHLNVKNCGVQEHDVVVFVSGEIDVRCHIGKQHEKSKKDLEEIIDSLADSYVKTIQANAAQYTHVRFFIMSVLPPTDHTPNPGYPFYGTLQERVVITLLLNAKLKQYATLQGIGYVDSHSLYVLEDGTLNMALSDGHVHVHPNQNGPCKEKLVDHIMNS